MRKRTWILGLSIGTVLLSAAAPRPADGDVERCRSNGSLCDDGFDCCSGICYDDGDDEYRCHGGGVE